MRDCLAGKQNTELSYSPTKCLIPLLMLIWRGSFQTLKVSVPLPASYSSCYLDRFDYFTHLICGHGNINAFGLSFQQMTIRDNLPCAG